MPASKRQFFFVYHLHIYYHHILTLKGLEKHSCVELDVRIVGRVSDCALIRFWGTMFASRSENVTCRRGTSRIAFHSIKKKKMITKIVCFGFRIILARFRLSQKVRTWSVNDPYGCSLLKPIVSLNQCAFCV